MNGARVGTRSGRRYIAVVRRFGAASDFETVTNNSGRIHRSGARNYRRIVTNDPLAPLLDFPGVADAADRARDALSAVHRHPRICADRQDRTERLRPGRSGRIDWGNVELRRDGDFDDPILAGAMRVSQAPDGNRSKT